jgi:hypothetical protein
MNHRYELFVGSNLDTKLSRAIKPIISCLLVSFLLLSTLNLSGISSLFKSAKAQGDLTITSLTINSAQSPASGETLTYQLTLSEAIGDVTGVNIFYWVNDEGLMKERSIYFSTTVQDNLLNLTAELPGFNANGDWAINTIVINSQSQSYTFNFQANPVVSSDFSFTSGNFTILDSLSDTQSPQLTSVQFSHDYIGPNMSVTVTAMATDDVSGLSTGYLELVKPDGTKIGLSLSNVNGVLSSDFFVNQFELAGEFKIGRVIINDRANNSIEYGNVEFYPEHSNPFDFSNTGFIVEGTSIAPLDVIVNEVQMESGDYEGNTTYPISIRVTPMNQNYQFAIAYFKDPNLKIKSVNLQYLGDGIFSGEILVRPYDAPGQYILDHIYFSVDGYPKVSYSQNAYPTQDLTFSVANDSFNVVGTTADVTPPTIQSVMIERSEIFAGTTNKLRVFTSDDFSMTQSVRVRYQSSNGQYYDYGLFLADENTFETQIYIVQAYAMLEWKLVSVELIDHAGNRVEYLSPDVVNLETLPVFDFSNGDFSILGVAPRAEVVAINNLDPILEYNDFVNVEISFLYLDDPYAPIVLKYKNAFGDFSVNGTYVGNSTYSFVSYDLPWQPNGEYQIQSISVYEDGSNFEIFNSNIFTFEEYSFDLSAADFHLLGGVDYATPAIIQSINVTNEGTIGSTITVEVIFDQVFEDVDWMQIRFTNEIGRNVVIDLNWSEGLTFLGTLSIHDYFASGNYHLNMIEIGYRWFPSQPMYIDNQFPGTSFNISGTLIDAQPPTFVSAMSVNKTVTRNESAVFTLEALDEQSGVNSVYGYLLCGLEEYWIPFESVGENRFVGSFDVYGYTPEGVCKFSRIIIADRSENGTEILNQEFYTEGVDLTSLNFEVVNTTSVEYRLNYTGASLSTRFIVGDGMIDFKLFFEEPFVDSYAIDALFVNEHGQEVTYYMSRIDDGVYFAYILSTMYSPSGRFQLKQVTAYQDWQTVTIYHSETETEYPYYDFSDVYYEVAGTIEDSSPPRIIGTSVNRDSATINEKIEFLIRAVDDETAIRDCIIQIKHLNQDYYISLYATKISENLYSAYFYVSPFMEAGSYYVDSIRIYDVASNMSFYWNSVDPSDEYDGYFNLDLRHLNFTIFGTSTDEIKPVLKSLHFAKNESRIGGLFEFYIDTIDEGTGTNMVTLNLVHTSTSQELQFSMNQLARGISFSQQWMPEDAALGDYVVKSLELVDVAGNYSLYCNSQVSSACATTFAQPYDFSDNLLKVLPKGDLVQADLFKSVYISSNSLVAGDELTVRIELYEQYWWANMFFINFNSSGNGSYLMLEFISKGFGVFEAVVSIDQYRKWNDFYTATSAQVVSGLRNEVFYDLEMAGLDPTMEYVSDLSAFKFQVFQQFEDITPPEFVNISFSKSQFLHYDFMHFDIDAIENETKLDYATVNLRHNGKVMPGHSMMNGIAYPFVDGKLVHNDMMIFPKVAPGLYEIDYITLTNTFGLKRFVFNEKFYGNRTDSRSFENSKFEVINENYDISPPQFVSANINGSQFAAGDTVQFIIEATDIGTGIGQGYISIQNRSAQFGNQSINYQSYQASFRKISDSQMVAEFDVTPYFTPGIYDVMALTIYDETYNRLTLYNSYFGVTNSTYDFSSLTFEVVGTQSDNVTPELYDVVPSSRVVALGDSFSVTILAQDSQSGIDFIHVLWECGHNRQFSAHGNAPKDPTQPIVLSGVVSSYLGACEYKVSNVYITDRAGNWRYYVQGDVDMPQFGILNFNDASIQVLGQAESVTIESMAVSDSNPLPLDLVEVSVDISEGIIKPETAVIHYRSNLLTERTVSLNLGGSLDYQGWTEIGEFEPSAIWEVDSIVFTDRFGEELVVYNSIFYPDELNSFDMSSGAFTVDNALGDLQAPQYTGSIMEKGTEQTSSLFSGRLLSSSPSTRLLSLNSSDSLVFRPNELVSYSIDASDDVSGVDRMEVTYDILGKLITLHVPLTFSDGKYVGSARIMNYHPAGLWLVHKFVLIDKAGNRFEKVREPGKLGNLSGFAHLQLNVVDTVEDNDAPTVSNLMISHAFAQLGDIVEFTALAEDLNGVKSFEIVIHARTYNVDRVVVMNLLDDGRYLGSVEITDNILGDIWDVKEIRVEDHAGNVGVVTQQTQDMSLLNFTVKGLIELVIEKLPDQLVYDLQDPLNLKGLVLLAKYNDGSSEYVNLSELTVYGFDSTSENLSQKVYVQYKNKIVEMTIKVMDVAMTALEITSSPVKLSYTQGETLDLQGLVVWGYYNSGETEQIYLTLEHVVNPQVTSSAPGTYQVFMQYEGFEVFYYIEVKAPVVENKTPVTIVKTDTMMVITTPVGKVKIIIFNKKSSSDLNLE